MILRDIGFHLLVSGQWSVVSCSSFPGAANDNMNNSSKKVKQTRSLLFPEFSCLQSMRNLRKSKPLTTDH
jgi:hypothetical protein